MSFPHYSNLRINEIEKKFYRHFCDLIVEGIKSNNISKEELGKRMTITNFELVEDLIKSGKSIAGVLGHMGNWEWAVLRISELASFPTSALYQPSSSKKFDKWIKNNRARFGANLVPSKEWRSLYQAIDKEPIGIGFLADQGPVNVKSSLWMYFLKQVTPVYRGVENIARKKDLAVLYFHISKKERGQYSITFELITDQPNTFQEDELTVIHTKLLEANIIEQPEIWLWTHRRWKRNHLKPDSVKVIDN